MAGQSSVPEHSSMGARLMIELAAPPRDEATTFRQWYDREHVPSRLTKEGVFSARKYLDLSSEMEWLACYDLPDSESARTHFVTGATSPSARSDYLGRLARFEQRLYERLSVPDVARGGTAPADCLLMAVWWTPAPGTVDDFNTWYDEEHIPMLMKVPGWLAIQRYRLVEGTGPAFVALHYLESLAVLDEPAHQLAVETPWRAKVASNREQHERRVFRPYRGERTGRQGHQS